jgi:hypothetical protein
MQKISKGIVELNSTANHLDIIIIYKLCHPAVTEHTFLFSLSKTFISVEHILGHKTCLNRFTRAGITQCLLSDHMALNLKLITER